MKIDMHCHTAEGSVDSKISLSDYMQILQDKGFDGMLITDHDSYNGCRAYDELAHKPENFVVLKGIEYDTFEAGHMLIIIPDGKMPPVFEWRGLPLAFVIGLVHFYGGIIGPAHPCGEPFLSIFSTGIYKRNHTILRQMDFVEGYNACESAEDNKRARMLASRFQLPLTGGSDSHHLDGIGFGYTKIPDNIHSENDLISYIKSGNATICGGKQYHGSLKDKLGKWNKLLVYGFFPYNKWNALRDYRGRKKALHMMLEEWIKL